MSSTSLSSLLDIGFAFDVAVNVVVVVATPTTGREALTSCVLLSGRSNERREENEEVEELGIYRNGAYVETREQEEVEA